MKLTPATRRALNRFEEAVREHAFMGSMHPEDHAAIELEYERAKLLLETQLAKIGTKKP